MFVYVSTEYSTIIGQFFDVNKHNFFQIKIFKKKCFFFASEIIN